MYDDEDEKFEYDFTVDFDAQLDGEAVPTFYLKRVCYGCPETIDIYLNDYGDNFEYIGYLRVRYGYLSVRDTSGESLYGTDEIKGDGMLDYDESDHFIKKACAVLYKNKIRNRAKNDQSYFDED